MGRLSFLFLTMTIVPDFVGIMLMQASILHQAIPSFSILVIDTFYRMTNYKFIHN
jgi:hypothetical protein